MEKEAQLWMIAAAFLVICLFVAYLCCFSYECVSEWFRNMKRKSFEVELNINSENVTFIAMNHTHLEEVKVEDQSNGEGKAL